MILKHIALQNFRNYSKAGFNFSPKTTIIVGPNAIGKSNLIEALYLLSTGKSNRSDKYKQLIQFGKNISRVKGVASESNSAKANAIEKEGLKATSNVANFENNIGLEVVFSETQTQFIQKKYLVNGVSKRRADYAGRMPVVLFTPLDLDIVAGQPGVRRRFLDEILDQTDPEYSGALLSYTKALRQRNALLEKVQITGFRDDKVFSYWDGLLINNGQIITHKRKELITYINKKKKDIFEFSLEYDSSTVSAERLLQYKQAEAGSGVTLVGPHRDDVIIKAANKISKTLEEVRYFGSRGQQRLVSLELKLSHIAAIKERSENNPILLLDDVFSELDSSNISHVLDLMNIYQTVATTTHKEFLGKREIKDMKMIELENNS